MGKMFVKDWKSIKHFGSKLSLNIGIRESRYKIIHRWYLTPRPLSVMFPVMDWKCWKCDFQNVFFYYVWWEHNVITVCGNRFNKKFS